MIDVDNLNRVCSKYPITICDKGWVYGVWYCGTSFTKSEMYGQHPPTYKKRLYALFPSAKTILHAPGGIVDHGEVGGRSIVTVDLVSRKSGFPSVIADTSALPFPDGTFDMIESDPPYSDADSLKYGTPQYPRRRAMDEFYRVLVDNGYLCWLDIRYPSYHRKKWKLVGLICVVTGFERLTRVCSIFQKVGVV